MRKTIRLICITSFIPIFILVGITAFVAPAADSIEIMVTHSHQHDESHHHTLADHQVDGSVEDLGSAEPSTSNGLHPNHHESTHEHTHSILISCVQVLMTEPSVDQLPSFCEGSISFATPEDLFPPRARASGSIFRPPIAV